MLTWRGEVAVVMIDLAKPAGQEAAVLEELGQRDGLRVLIPVKYRTGFSLSIQKWEDR